MSLVDLLDLVIRIMFLTQTIQISEFGHTNEILIVESNCLLADYTKLVIC